MKIGIYLGDGSIDMAWMQIFYFVCVVCKFHNMLEWETSKDAINDLQRPGGQF